MNKILKSFILLVFVLSEIAFGSFADSKSRYSVNLKGNMKTIGNTVLCPKNSSGQCIESGNNLSNSEVDLRYVDIDSDTSTFNSSAAVLDDSAILTPTAGKVKWAGLYWSGYLSKSKYTQAQANDLINNHTVKLSIAGGSYIDITTHTVLGQFANGSYQGTSYGCFADVTNLIATDPRGTYKVANIPSTEGQTNSNGDGLGNSGAWTLVVIYENNSVGEKTRNASVFDGFIKISSGNPKTINVSGFKTPKAGSVDSTLSVFANEGDKYIAGDQFIFKNTNGDKVGQSATLSSSNGNNNYFNSSITGVDNRTPNVTNNNGIDIHTDQMGTSGYDVVSTNQTAAQITMTSSQDTYFPVMVGFATELYVPTLCYDYSVTLDNQLMARGESNRTFIPHNNNGVLRTEVFIRSLEGDFPYVRSSLKSYWTDIRTPPPQNPSLFTFTDASVQNPDEFAYSTPEYIDKTNGKYYIGNDRSTNGGQKGTIDPYKSVYAISNFDAKKLNDSKIRLDIDVNASVALDESNPTSFTQYNFSTSNGSIEICKGTPTYNPKWYEFNVEDIRSTELNPNYALSTQVTGTDYNLQVVSYTKDTDGNYTKRTPYTGALEVEVFEVPSFESLGSYDMTKYSFDRICEDSSNRKDWGDNKRHFSLFEGGKTTPLDILADDNKYAMRNAGVRIWTLTDGNNTLVTHDGIHFKKLYTDTPKYLSDARLTPACTTGTESECYESLKKYYGRPTCSRDNFSVRPYGIELNATTSNSGKTLKTGIKDNRTPASNTPNLISGLVDDYEVILKAKSKYKNGEIKDTNGYYFRRISTNAKDIANNLFDTLTEFFGLKFDNSKINDTSKDITKCDDSTHKRFDTGASGWKLENNNIGTYDVLLIDKDWTIVDQKRYKYKAPVSKNQDDCILNHTTLNATGQQGCDVQSFEVNNDTKFNKIPVKFVPAKIDVQTIVKPTRAWSYMNDLTDPNTSLDISAKFAGTMTAMNAINAPTTNFTAGCFAQDVDLNMNYSSSGLDNSGNAVTNNKFGIQYAQSLNGNTHAIKNDPFVSDVIPETKTDTNSTDKQLNLRTRVATIGLPAGAITPAISKDEFLDSNKGSIAYDLRISIRKILDAVINPIEMLFLDLKSKLYDSDGKATEVYKAGYTPAELTAQGNGATPNIVDNKNYYTNDTSKSLADQITDRLNNSYAFIYGTVYTPLMSGATQSIATLTRDVVLSVVGYCDADCDKYSQSPYSVFEKDSTDATKSKETTTNWYRMVAHDKDNDGEIAQISSNGALATIDGGATKANVKFDRAAIPNAGNTQDITLGYPMNGRDQLVEYTITPSAWLAYKIATVGAGTNPLFMINWINPVFKWTGKGANVGSAVQMTPQPSTKRLSW